mmetsp:Transcript_5578/g.13457  ORF Transcript_5578/g.13457 Transcript_5578/m.13457 type:complete len:203 (-) Transcript_5578:187-795(-)
MSANMKTDVKTNIMRLEMLVKEARAMRRRCMMTGDRATMRTKRSAVRDRSIAWLVGVASSTWAKRYAHEKRTHRASNECSPCESSLDRVRAAMSRIVNSTMKRTLVQRSRFQRVSLSKSLRARTTMCTRIFARTATSKRGLDVTFCTACATLVCFLFLRSMRAICANTSTVMAVGPTSDSSRRSSFLPPYLLRTVASSPPFE